MKRKIYEDSKRYILLNNIAKDIIQESLLGVDVEKSEETIHFLNDNKKKSKLIERLESPNEMEQLINVLREDKKENLNLFREKLEKQKRKLKIKKIVYLTYGVAASLIFLIFYIPSILLQDVPIDQKVPVDYEKTSVVTPTLILGSGKVVNLNSELGVDENENNIAKIEGNRVKYSKSNLRKETISYNKLIVPVGFTYNLELSDGTFIIVNAGGEIKYPTVFNGDIREVELIGEAYFDVAKSNIPFVVKVGNSAVQVYGTQFNINYSRSLKFIETVLIKGEVGFKQEGNKETILKPNERLIYVNSIITVETIKGKDMIAWKDGTFNFTNQSVERVLNDIENWYGVKFHATTSIKSKKISMYCNKDVSIDDILKLMEEILDVEIENKKGGVYEVMDTK